MKLLHVELHVEAQQKYAHHLQLFIKIKRSSNRSLDYAGESLLYFNWKSILFLVTWTGKFTKKPPAYKVSEVH